MDDVCSLCLTETLQLGESLEKLATLDDLRYNVEVFIVFQQVHYSNDVRVTFAAKNAQLVL